MATQRTHLGRKTLVGRARSRSVRPPIKSNAGKPRGSEARVLWGNVKMGECFALAILAIDAAACSAATASKQAEPDAVRARRHKSPPRGQKLGSRLCEAAGPEETQ